MVEQVDHSHNVVDAQNRRQKRARSHRARLPPGLCCQGFCLAVVLMFFGAALSKGQMWGQIPAAIVAFTVVKMCF